MPSRRNGKPRVRLAIFQLEKALTKRPSSGKTRSKDRSDIKLLFRSQKKQGE